MLRNIDWYVVLLCLAVAAGVTLLRVGLVESVAVWTEDGRLAVHPWVFAALNGAHIGLTFAILAAILFPYRHQPPEAV